MVEILDECTIHAGSVQKKNLTLEYDRQIIDN